MGIFRIIRGIIKRELSLLISEILPIPYTLCGFIRGSRVLRLKYLENKTILCSISPLIFQDGGPNSNIGSTSALGLRLVFDG